jgi:tRNA(Ile)-lysidine synthase
VQPLNTSTSDSQDAVDAATARWLRAFAYDARLCVAYSGGIDSSVLLHALVKASRETKRGAISAIHVHHGLSTNADAWAALCEAQCAALAVPLVVVRVRVEHRSALGVEAAARKARYAALRAHAEDQGCTIALAHHARDQAETVLLQLLRGAGPAGLAAMPEASAPFARPLLHVAKDAIDRYASEQAIAHIVDDSNADPRFARNRLRLHVWPTLAEAFSSAETTLARAAAWQRDADLLAENLAHIDLATCTDHEALVASKWRALSSARRRNALRHWLRARGVALPTADRLCEWEKQLMTDNATQNVVLAHASFSGSIRLYRDRIQHVAPAHVDLEQRRPGLRWSGEAAIPFGEKTVHFRSVQASENANSSVVLRPIKYGDSWRLRIRRDGDCIVLSPQAGSVSMKNIFQKAGIPPWLRAEWPILTCNGVIAAVPGLAIAQTFRGDAISGGYALSWE